MIEKSALSALGTNLRRARSVKRKSQTEVADAAGMSRVGYRNIEAGDSAPRINSLMKIAGVLGVSLQDLLAPATELKSVRFRAQKKMTTRETLLVEVARRLADYRQLEELLGEQKDWKLKLVAEKLRKRSPKRAREAAIAARDALGIRPDETIRNICGLLEERGGVKVLAPQVASEGFFGLSVSEQGLGPAIVVNTWERISVERWIFTAAHELGHLLMHASAYNVEEAEEDSDEETEADQFASHLLMPEDLFVRERAKCKGLRFVDLVLSLKRTFHVSYKTVVYRIAEDKPKDERRFVWMTLQTDYRNKFGKGLMRADEPDRLPATAFSATPPERSSEEPARLVHYDFVEARLHRLVREAIEANHIGLGRGAEILGKSVEEMNELSGAWMK